MTIALSDYRPFQIYRWNLLNWHEIVAIEFTIDPDMPQYELWCRIDSDWYSTNNTITTDRIVYMHQHRNEHNYSCCGAYKLQFTSSGGKGDIHKGLFKYCTNVHTFNSWDEFSLFMDKLSVLEVL